MPSRTLGRHAIVDAGRGAAEIVGQGGGIAVAQRRARAADRAAPDAERARQVAGGDVARLGQRLALAAARAGQPAPRHRHLLAERAHEQDVAGEVRGAEVGPRLAADRAQRCGTLRRRETGQRADHRGVVARRAGVGLVQGVADGALVGRVAAKSGEGGALQRQGQIHVVGVVAQRRSQEREVADDAGIGAVEAARCTQNRVGGAVGVNAGLGRQPHAGAVDGRDAADIDAVALARAVDFNVIVAACFRQVAGDAERADRIARGDVAIDGGHMPDHTVAEESAAVRQDYGAVGDAASHVKGTLVSDRGRAGIGIVAVDPQVATTRHGHAAGARDHTTIGASCALHIEHDGAIVDDIPGHEALECQDAGRHDRAAGVAIAPQRQGAGADLGERAGTGDGSGERNVVAIGVEYAAVGPQRVEL